MSKTGRRIAGLEDAVLERATLKLTKRAALVPNKNGSREIRRIRLKLEKECKKRRISFVTVSDAQTWVKRMFRELYARDQLFDFIQAIMKHADETAVTLAS